MAGAFSFYPTKNLGALGDGGAVVTERRRPGGARVARLRNGGQTRRYHHDEFGVNTRLDEMQAAILRERLRYLPAWTAKRRELARTYREGLAGVRITVPRGVRSRTRVSPVPGADAGPRAVPGAPRGARGIETLVHYPIPIPNQPALADERPAGVRSRTACAELRLAADVSRAVAGAAREIAAAVREFDGE